MIAKAIDKICSLADPYMTQINGSTYSSKQLYRYDTDLRAEPIEVKTLTGSGDLCSGCFKVRRFVAVATL